MRRTWRYNIVVGLFVVFLATYAPDSFVGLVAQAVLLAFAGFVSFQAGALQQVEAYERIEPESWPTVTRPRLWLPFLPAVTYALLFLGASNWFLQFTFGCLVGLDSFFFGGAWHRYHTQVIDEQVK